MQGGCFRAEIRFEDLFPHPSQPRQSGNAVVHPREWDYHMRRSGFEKALGGNLGTREEHA